MANELFSTGCAGCDGAFEGFGVTAKKENELASLSMKGKEGETHLTVPLVYLNCGGSEATALISNTCRVMATEIQSVRSAMFTPGQTL